MKKEYKKAWPAEDDDSFEAYLYLFWDRENDLVLFKVMREDYGDFTKEHNNDMCKNNVRSIREGRKPVYNRWQKKIEDYVGRQA